MKEGWQAVVFEAPKELVHKYDQIIKKLYAKRSDALRQHMMQTVESGECDFSKNVEKRATQ